MDNILRVGLMCRVSTEEQALHGDSMQAQEDSLVAYAAEHQMKIVNIYRDEGFSARKPVLKRPAMLELIEDVKAGKIDIIIFTKLDRWFRNLEQYYSVQKILDKHGVVWKAILEDYSTASADGRLKVNIMLSVAENEADRTSERIKFVFQSKVMRKEAIFANHSAPFGYKVVEIDGINRVVKNEEHREAVEFFFSNASISSIRQATLMTNEKFNLKRDYKDYLKMCYNDFYTGTYKGVENYCEPYLTPQQFQELSKPKTARQPQGNRVYLFSGLITCPKCGRNMVAKSNNHHSNKEIEYHSYRCSNSISKLCNTSGISEKRVEKYVLENTSKELEKFILSHEVAQSKPKQRSDVAKLKEQLRRVNVSYHAGNMEDAEYLAETKRIKTMIEKATKLENADSPVDIEALKDFLNSGFEKIYDSLGKEEQQRLWRSIIDELIYDGHDIVGIKFRT